VQRGPNPDRHYFYYRCSYHERHDNPICEKNNTIKRERLEDAVANLLRDQMLTTQNVQKLVEDAQRELERQQQQNDLDKALRCVELDLREVAI